MQQIKIKIAHTHACVQKDLVVNIQQIKATVKRDLRIQKGQ